MVNFNAVDKRRQRLLAQLKRCVSSDVDNMEETVTIVSLQNLKCRMEEVKQKHNDVLDELIVFDECLVPVIDEASKTFDDVFIPALDKVTTLIEMMSKQPERNLLEDLDAFDEKISTLTERALESQLTAGSCQVFLEELSCLQLELKASFEKVIRSSELVEDRKHFAQRRDQLLMSISILKVEIIDRQSTFAAPQPNETRHHRDVTTAKIKLPTIELPKFDGSPDLWISFRDTFKSIIHDNADLTGSTKFRYLKAQIVDKLSPIAHRIESDEGYMDAWETILDFYDDKRRISDKHIAGIILSKRMSSESHDELQRLINEVQSHTSALEREMSKEDLYDAIIANIVIHRLDPNTHNLFETANKEVIPKWPALKTFLDQRRKILLTLPAHRSTSKPQTALKPPAYSPLKPQKLSNSFVASNKGVLTSNEKCMFCKTEGHRLFSCPNFMELNVQQRIAKVTELNLCSNCLGYHQLDRCTSKYTCSVCQEKHNTLLHLDTTESLETTALLSKLSKLQSMEGATCLPTLSCDAAEFSPQSITKNGLTVNNKAEAMVFLSTAMVKIQDSNGKWHEARALLDSGSDGNFMTKQLSDVLKISTTSTLIRTNGFGEKESTITSKAIAKIGATNGWYEKDMEFLITDTITGLTPTTTFNEESLAIPEYVALADPNFGNPRMIDLLIGNEHFLKLLLSDRIQLKCGPMLQKTVFGYIVSGKTAKSNAVLTRHCHLQQQLCREDPVTTCQTAANSKKSRAKSTRTPSSKENVKISNDIDTLSNPFLQWSEDSGRSFSTKWKLAYVTRFVFNLRARRTNQSKRIGQLTSADLQEAEDSLIRMHQVAYFSNEVNRLRAAKQILPSSRLKNLDPIWDKERRFMLVGGRLQHAKDIDENQKHPVILPSDCQLTRQIVRETHERAMHAGQQATHGILKLKYWPLRANEIVRRECHKCARCFRARQKTFEQSMGQQSRVSTDPSLVDNRVDAGPIIPLRDNQKDLKMLTNSHILIKRPLNVLSRLNLIEASLMKVEGQQSFWKRWTTEYLHPIPRNKLDNEIVKSPEYVNQD